jgi:arabinogalactan oligomer/maltooligosaccharide transport system permease protein
MRSSSNKMKKSYKRSRKITNGIIYIILTVMAIFWLSPIVWLLIRSFQGEKGAWITTLLPKQWTLSNYTRLFTQTDMFNYTLWFLNTFKIAVFTCIISTLLILMVSYCYSRLRFKSRKAFMNLGLVLGMFPGFMTMIAIYHILKAFGLYQSHISLILVYSSGACLAYFIPKGFFDMLSRSMDEAAIIDGATRSQVFWKIIIPMSKPIVVYTALTSFLAPWLDFIFASIIMKDNYDKYTMAVGLFKMLERENLYEYFTRFCAGAVLVSIPITILFICFQGYYVEGVAGGSTKG